jgi:ESS family glutamate:Na+ symporter
LQAIFGFGLTLIIAAFFLTDFFPAAGMLLPFGYGQGSGQALNYGYIYQTDFGFSGGTTFGLAIAALGFVSAAIGGVIHMNIRRRSGKLIIGAAAAEHFNSEDIQTDDEIPMQESVDKLTIQVALVAVAYLVTYLLMFLLSKLIPSMTAVIYGFNFLLGVISATIVKHLFRFLHKKNIMKKEYTNNFLLTRISNFFFDIMIIAGMAAISLDIIGQYLGILLILGLVGALVTYIYNRIVARYLFSRYKDEQFLAMYGMLTGTASTGIVLLREIDPNFDTPAADNLVYQILPAIAFGFPMMLLATLAPRKPLLTMIIFVLFFLALNIILFRSYIFRKKRRNKKNK